MIDEAGCDYSQLGYKKQNLNNGIDVFSLNVTKNNLVSNFNVGLYKIVSCKNLFIAPKHKQNALVDILVKQLNKLLTELKISKKQTVLVCGLGNGEIMADSLGVEVCKKVLATKNLKSELIHSKVSTLAPNVQTVTGISTYDIVHGVAKEINAKLIILVDSLITNNVERVGHSFQMSSCGIVPGGAVANNKEISYTTTGIKCLTIGVPFMLNLKDLSEEINKNIIVAPKDIKQMINICSNIIASSINILFNPNLKKEEICELLNTF